MATRKLLLADDSVTIQKVVNLTFADEGIEVIAVGDGDAAMQKFTESTPDLVMVDVNMPGLDGYRICEMIKQDDETKHIPVILLVGSFEPFDEEEAKRVGADDFLTKPFQSIRQLVNKVSDLLNAEKNAVADKTAVNSFDDTLENEPFDDESDSTENLGDAGMDDEMIQTSQIGSVPTDEAQKFASGHVYESSDETADFAALESPYNFEKTAEYTTDDDWAETQPSLKEEFDQADGASKTALTDDGVDDFADEEDDSAQEDLNEEFEQILVKNKNSDSTAEKPTVFALDDFDLLELPQSKKGSSAKTRTPDKFRASEISANDNQDSSPATAADVFAPTNGLSPEMIEAIADKVAEKLSDKVIKNAVREVLNQSAKNI